MSMLYSFVPGIGDPRRQQWMDIITVGIIAKLALLSGRTFLLVLFERTEDFPRSA